jgi:Leucine-rich repeat (LRR) protein
MLNNEARTLSNLLVESNLKEKRLILTGLKIVSIDSNAFENHTTHISEISLERNELKILYIQTFRSLINLKKLNLSFNNLTRIEPGIFKELSSLEELLITNNKIESISGGTFEGLSHLKRLILSENETKFIDPDAFIGLKKLDTLVLAFNLIQYIHPNTFDDLESLIRLNIKQNEISSLSPGTFNGLKNLAQLIFSANKMSFLDTELLMSLKNLERLFMRDNQLTVIQSDLFHGLNKLKLIDLEMNEIGYVSSDTFKNLPRLEIIDLSKNKIETIHSGSFSNLPKLENLNLSKNLIRVIHSDAFIQLPILKIIKLDFNLVTHLEPAVFENLTELIELYCNTLSTTSMKSIQKVTIDRNREIYSQQVDFICELNEARAILETVGAFKKLEFISSCSNPSKYELLQLVEPEKQQTFVTVIIEVMKKLYENIGTHIKRYKPYIETPSCLALNYLKCILGIVANYSNSSLSFCRTFVLSDGIRILFDYLNVEVLEQELKSRSSTDSKYSINILLDVYQNLISSIYNLIIKGNFKS